MTKIKRSKPSEKLLALKRSEEICNAPKDYALKDKRQFFNSVQTLPSLRTYVLFTIFYLSTLIFGSKDSQ